MWYLNPSIAFGHTNYEILKKINKNFTMTADFDCIKNVILAERSSNF